MKTITAFATILMISILLFACNFYSDKNLGANYWFWEDGNQSAIVYGDENSAQGGFGVIDANVSQYNFNDKYIIARSNWLTKKGLDTYWIIDKEVEIKKDTSIKAELYERELKKGLIGPLDKNRFDLFLQEHNINLKLKTAF